MSRASGGSSGLAFELPLRWPRLASIRAFEQARGSRAILMIHRQEPISLLSIPLSKFINIEDSEQILRAIRLTPSAAPIDLVLHTPGGLVLATEQSWVRFSTAN